MKHLFVGLFVFCSLLSAAAQNGPARHIEKAVKELEKTVNTGEVVINRDRKTKEVTSLLKRYKFRSTQGKTFRNLWNAFLADAPKATSEVRRDNSITLLFHEDKKEWTYILNGSGGTSNISVDLSIFFRDTRYSADSAPASSRSRFGDFYAYGLPEGTEGRFSEKYRKQMEQLDSLKNWKDLKKLKRLKGLDRLKDLERLKDLDWEGLFRHPEYFTQQVDSLKALRSLPESLKKWLERLENEGADSTIAIRFKDEHLPAGPAGECRSRNGRKE